MSGITIDPIQIHSNDLGERAGFFHGTPIVQWNPQTTQDREDADRRKRIVQSKVSQ